jgi:hypothetical protein
MEHKKTRGASTTPRNKITQVLGVTLTKTDKCLGALNHVGDRAGQKRFQRLMLSARVANELAKRSNKKHTKTTDTE